MALPASLSAFMGITEPAIFGVNLRFFRPFIAGSIGGACGALYASIVGLGATGTGVTGIFGVLLHLHHPIQYIITIAIATGVAFVVSWFIGLPKRSCRRSRKHPRQRRRRRSLHRPWQRRSRGQRDHCFPLSGEAVPLSETGDPAFSARRSARALRCVRARARCLHPVTQLCPRSWATRSA